MDAPKLLEKASALAESGDVDGAFAILEELREYITSDGDRGGDDELLTYLDVETAGLLMLSGRGDEARARLMEDLERLGDTAEPGLVARVQTEIARLLIDSDPEEALSHAVVADTLASELEDPEPRLLTLSLIIDILAEGGMWDAVTEVSSALAELAHTLGDGEVEAAALTSAAEALLAQDHDDEALDLSRRAYYLAETGVAGPRTFERAAQARGVAATRAERPLEAVEAFDAAMSASQRARDEDGDEESTDPHLVVAGARAHLQFGELPPAMSAAVRQVADIENSDDYESSAADDARLILFDQATDDGRLDEAEALLASFPDEDDPDGAPALTLARARLAVLRGDTITALESLDRLVSALPNEAAPRLLRSQALWLSDQPAEAVAELDLIIEDAEAQGAAAETVARLRRAAYALTLGDVASARRDARRAAQVAEEQEATFNTVLARILLARCDIADDDLESATAQLEEAVAAAHRTGLTGGAAAAALVLARSLSVEGAQDQAIEMLERARDDADASDDVRLRVLTRVLLAGARGASLGGASQSGTSDSSSSDSVLEGRREASQLLLVARTLNDSHGVGLDELIAAMETQLGLTIAEA